MKDHLLHKGQILCAYAAEKVLNADVLFCRKCVLYEKVKELKETILIQKRKEEWYDKQKLKR